MKDSRIAAVGDKLIVGIFSAVGMDTFPTMDEVDVSDYALLLDFTGAKNKAFDSIPYPIILPIEVKL